MLFLQVEAKLRLVPGSAKLGLTESDEVRGRLCQLCDTGKVFGMPSLSLRFTVPQLIEELIGIFEGARRNFGHDDLLVDLGEEGFRRNGHGERLGIL